MDRTIIPMAPAHVPQVAALERENFSAPWDEASLLRELENPLSLWLTAMDGDVVAGYIGSQSVLGESDVMNLAVRPDYRRQGVGTALMDFVKQYAAEQDFDTVELDVWEFNEGARQFYEAVGFQTYRRYMEYKA